MTLQSPPTLTLPPEPQSVRRARRFSEQCLRDHRPDATADHINSVVLIVSELVTNSVRYGTEPGDSLRLVLDVVPERTVVEVQTRSATARGRAPRPRRGTAGAAWSSSTSCARGCGAPGTARWARLSGRPS
ncbi:ATP-binding protein [Streptomyces sp. NPDC002640]